MWPIIAYNIITNNNLWQYKLKVMWDSKQNQDKNMYLKVVLNRLNIRCDFIFIYTHWASNSKNFSKNFQPTCGPCSPMCDPCAPMCG
jgi:hypothetical protein